MSILYNIWMFFYLLVAILGLTELLLDRQIYKFGIELAKERRKRGFPGNINLPLISRFSMVIHYNFPDYLTSNTSPNYSNYTYIFAHKDINFWHKCILSIIWPVIMIVVIGIAINLIIKKKANPRDIMEPITKRINTINFYKKKLDGYIEEDYQKEKAMLNLSMIEIQNFKKDLL